MKHKRVSRKNAIYTAHSSGTTVMVNYDEKGKILEVEFTGGRVYHYLKVESQIWEEYKAIIKAGGSSGTFINARIKPFYKDVEVTDL
jgi:YD repeat-containing protein